MAFDLQFLGAAGTVTGSRYLITFEGRKILVDCGMFQGLKSLRLKNWDEFPVKPSEIDALVLTHAHIDHSGYIPRLIKEGFRGKIFATPATKDLCKILLADSGHLMEEEARFLNKHKRTKHKPALPFFTEKEAIQSIERFEAVPFKKKISLFPNFDFEFQYAGHIFGAASIIFSISDRKIAFTGDIGRLNDEVLYPPALLPQVDYLVTESTYGDRAHKETDVASELANIINESYAKKGVIVIPAFAVGRAQLLMYHLSTLKRQNKIPDFPMYLNSPMATNISDLLCKHKDIHRLSEPVCTDTCDVVTYIRTVDESKRLNEKTGPMLIISASGMLTGGRVLHHLKAFGSDPKNTILLAGYQAAGTRGDALVRGAKEVKIHGEYVQIKAAVKSLDNIFAHADYKEIIQWLSEAKIKPRKVFVTHGDPTAADALRRRLTETFAWDCFVPSLEEKVRLD